MLNTRTHQMPLKIKINIENIYLIIFKIIKNQSKGVNVCLTNYYLLYKLIVTDSRGIQYTRYTRTVSDV